MKVYLVFAANGTKGNAGGLDITSNDDTLKAVVDSFETGAAWIKRWDDTNPGIRVLHYTEAADVLTLDFVSRMKNK